MSGRRLGAKYPACYNPPEFMALGILYPIARFSIRRST